jgi:hypothetical protein
MSSNINIGEFVREVANASATDLPALCTLQGKLHEITAAIPTVNHPELGFMMDAASDLLRYLSEGQQPSAQAMLTMVTRLLVNSECSMYRNLEVLSSLAEPENSMAPGGPSVAVTAKGPLRLDPAGVAREKPDDLSSMRIGQFLVQLGIVTSQQVTDALEVQRTEKLRLGETLTKLGYIIPAELKDALSLRDKMLDYAGGEAESQEPSGLAAKPKLEIDEWQESLLGSILVSNEALTVEQLEKGLSIQKATGMRLGEALVQHGYCEWRQVREAIRAQESLRHSSKLMININVPPTKGGVKRRWA